MKEQIPPGIVAFSNRFGNIFPNGRIDINEGYESWVDWSLHKGHTIHTISVDGQEWSVGDKTDYGIIESFEYRADSHGEGMYWFATTPGVIIMMDNLTKQPKEDSPLTQDQAEKWWDDNVKPFKGIDLSDPPSPPPSHVEGEEKKWSQDEMDAYVKLYTDDLVTKHNAELQSLKQSNAKLVEALKVAEDVMWKAHGDIARNGDHYVYLSKARNIVTKALSSLTDNQNTKP